MELFDYFSANYREARGKFLDGCKNARARIESFECPAPGPDGKPVYCDVAMLGDHASDRVLMMNSATHGVEGFCGSAVLTGWLHSERYRELPGNIRTVLIHAINPHGFAWLRRVNEDNVDLNRNFVLHNGHYPSNPEYTKLQKVILPQRWDKKALSNAQVAFATFMAQHGKEALQSVLTRGQYDHPDGIFYGGRSETWSNRTFRTILADHVSTARHVAFLDFHTGLGPYGTAEIISDMPPGSEDEDRLRGWFGPGVTAMGAYNSASAALTGIIADAIPQALPGATVSAATIEYGTYPPEEVLFALQADNWLHLRGDPDSALGRQIKATIRSRLYPDENDWKELVYVRARQLIDRAAKGLAAG